MAEGDQKEGNSLIDKCYDLVNSFSEDEHSIDTAEDKDEDTSGAICAAFIAGFEAGAIETANPSWCVPAAAMHLEDAHEAVHEVGQHIVLPLTASAELADGLPSSNFAGGVVNLHAELANPVLAAPTAPTIPSGFDVMPSVLEAGPPNSSGHESYAAYDSSFNHGSGTSSDSATENGPSI